MLHPSEVDAIIDTEMARQEPLRNRTKDGPKPWGGFKPYSGRRRLINPTTTDRDYTPQEVEFMNAMEAYKQRSRRMFPTWSEALEVLVSLGYAKR